MLLARAAQMLAGGNPRAQQAATFKAWSDFARHGRMQEVRAQQVMMALAGPSSQLLLSIALIAWTRACSDAKHLLQRDEALKQAEQQKTMLLARAARMLAAGNPRAQKAAAFKAWADFVQHAIVTEARADVMMALAGPPNQLMLSIALSAWSKVCSEARYLLLEQQRDNAIKHSEHQKSMLLARAAQMLAAGNPRAQQAATFKAWSDFARHGRMQEVRAQQVMMALAGPSSQLLLSIALSAWTRACSDAKHLLQRDEALKQAEQQKTMLLAQAARMLAAGNPKAQKTAVFKAWADFVQHAIVKEVRADVMMALAGPPNQLMLSIALSAWSKVCSEARYLLSEQQRENAIKHSEHQKSMLLARAAQMLAAGTPRAQQTATFKAWSDFARHGRMQEVRAQQVMMALAGPSRQLLLSIALNAWTRAYSDAKHLLQRDEALKQAEQQKTMLLARAARMLAAGNPRAQKAAAFKAWADFVQHAIVKEVRADVMMALAGPPNQLMLSIALSAWSKVCSEARYLLSEQQRDNAIKHSEHQKSMLLARAAQMLAAGTPRAQQTATFKAWSDFARHGRMQEVRAQQVMMALAGPSSQLLLSIALSAWTRACSDAKHLLQRDEALKQAEQQKTMLLARAARMLAAGNPRAQKAAAFKAWADFVQHAIVKEVRADVMMALAGPPNQLMLSIALSAWSKVCSEARYLLLEQQRDNAIKHSEHQKSMLFARAAQMLAGGNPRAQQAATFKAWSDFARHGRMQEVRAQQVMMALAGPSSQLLLSIALSAWTRAYSDAKHLLQRDEALKQAEQQKTMLLARAARMLAAGSPKAQKAAAFKAWADFVQHAIVTEVRADVMMALAGPPNQLMLSIALSAWSKVCSEARYLLSEQQRENAIKHFEHQKSMLLARAAQMLAGGNPRAQQAATFKAWSDFARHGRMQEVRAQQVMMALAGPSSQLLLSIALSAWTRACSDAKHLLQRDEALKQAEQQKTMLLARAARMLAAGNPRAQKAAAFKAWADFVQHAIVKEVRADVMMASAGPPNQLMLSIALSAWSKVCSEARYLMSEQQRDNAIKHSEHQKSMLLARAAQMLAAGTPRAQQAATFKAWSDFARHGRMQEVRAQQVMMALAGPSRQLLLSIALNAWTRACSDAKHLLQRDEALKQAEQQSNAACSAARMLAADNLAAQKACSFQSLGHLFHLPLSEEIMLLPCSSDLAAGTPRAQQTATFKAWSDFARHGRMQEVRAQQVMMALAGPSRQLLLSIALNAWTRAYSDAKHLLQRDEALKQAEQQKTMLLARAARMLAADNPRAQKAAAFKAWADFVQHAIVKEVRADVMMALAGPPNQLMLSIALSAWSEVCSHARYLLLEQQRDLAVQKAELQKSKLLARAAQMLAAGTPRAQQAATFKAWSDFARHGRMQEVRAQQVMMALAGPSSQLLLSIAFNAWTRAYSDAKHLLQRDEALKQAEQQKTMLLARAARMLAAGNPRAQKAAAFKAWADFVQHAIVTEVRADVMMVLAGPPNQLMLSIALSAWSKVCSEARYLLLEQQRDLAVQKAELQKSKLLARAAQMLAAGTPRAQQTATFKAWSDFATHGRMQEVRAQQVMMALAGPSSQLILSLVFSAWNKACLESIFERHRNEALKQAEQNQAALLARAARMLTAGSPRAQKAAAFKAWADFARHVRVREARTKQVMMALAGPCSQLSLSMAFSAWTKVCSKARHLVLERQLDQALSMAKQQRAAVVSRAAHFLAVDNPRRLQAASFRSWAELCRHSKIKATRALQAGLLLEAAASQLTLTVTFSTWARFHFSSACDKTIASACALAEDAADKTGQRYSEWLMVAVDLLARTRPKAQRCSAWRAWAVLANRARLVTAFVRAKSSALQRRSLAAALTCWAHASDLARLQAITLKSRESVIDGQAAALSSASTATWALLALALASWAGEVRRAAAEAQMRRLRSHLLQSISWKLRGGFHGKLLLGTLWKWRATSIHEALRRSRDKSEVRAAALDAAAQALRFVPPTLHAATRALWAWRLTAASSQEGRAGRRMLLCKLRLAQEDQRQVLHRLLLLQALSAWRFLCSLRLGLRSCLLAETSRPSFSLEPLAVPQLSQQVKMVPALVKTTLWAPGEWVKRFHLLAWRGAVKPLAEEVSVRFVEQHSHSSTAQDPFVSYVIPQPCQQSQAQQVWDGSHMMIDRGIPRQTNLLRSLSAAEESRISTASSVQIGHDSMAHWR
ncbi:unnamed protein product [Polarella glacialis]|uniref:Uncharacterized protein n=1 Tax=Polarella glacialis TaxID=89957 RepID=A0A813KE44_POLGL|nr:unnamed protein product [Polarella glacialis]